MHYKSPVAKWRWRWGLHAAFQYQVSAAGSGHKHCFVEPRGGNVIGRAQLGVLAVKVNQINVFQVHVGIAQQRIHGSRTALGQARQHGGDGGIGFIVFFLLGGSARNLHKIFKMALAILVSVATGDEQKLPSRCCTQIVATWG